MATNNNEFFDALAALEKERGLPADYLIDKIKAAIVIAVKKDYEVEDDNVVVDIDPNIGAFRASLLQDIVEEVENPHTQVSLEDAQKIRKTYKVGQRLVTPLKTKEFGRIAAQTAKHVIRQGLREGERSLPVPARCSPVHTRSSPAPLPLWMQSAATSCWISARAAALFCPKTSRCPVNTLPKARWSRFMWSMFWQPSAAPA